MASLLVTEGIAEGIANGKDHKTLVFIAALAIVKHLM